MKKHLIRAFVFKGSGMVDDLYNKLQFGKHGTTLQWKLGIMEKSHVSFNHMSVTSFGYPILLRSM